MYRDGEKFSVVLKGEEDMRLLDQNIGPKNNFLKSRLLTVAEPELQ